jgi:hypothetical protein
VRAEYRLKLEFDWITKRLLHRIPMAHASTLEGANWREIFPAEPFEMARPAALNDNDWAVFQSAMKPVVPAARLIDLWDAFVFGEDSWIFDSEGVAVLGMWDREAANLRAWRRFARAAGKSGAPGWRHARPQPSLRRRLLSLRDPGHAEACDRGASD